MAVKAMLAEPKRNAGMGWIIWRITSIPQIAKRAITRITQLGTVDTCGSTVDK